MRVVGDAAGAAAGADAAAAPGARLESGTAGQCCGDASCCASCPGDSSDSSCTGCSGRPTGCPVAPPPGRQRLDLEYGRCQGNGADDVKTLARSASRARKSCARQSKKANHASGSQAGRELLQHAQQQGEALFSMLNSRSRRVLRRIEIAAQIAHAKEKSASQIAANHREASSVTPLS